MTKLYDTTQISRRKVLAGLGTIGVAAAGAGIGTSAFFSDQETFAGNRLVAGSLDMKVDWEEHYSDGMGVETEFAEMADPATADYVLPAPLNSPDKRDIALNFVGGFSDQNSKDSFWDATSIEAFPDSNDDGIQDGFDDAEACEFLGDVGDVGPGFSNALESEFRTEGTVNGQTTESGDPLVDISDVKPGDFGEVTFSFHLCDNPGYVWMNGQLVEAAENGHTEPEQNDPDTVGPEDEMSSDLAESQVELLDEIQTRFWYDDGDNQLAIGDEPTDLVIVVDRSISIVESEMDDLKAGLSAFIDSLPNDPDLRAGVVTFGNNSVSIEQDIVQKDDFTFDPNSDLPTRGRGNTPLPPALDIADQLLDARNTGARKVIVTFTDGGPNYDNRTYSASVGSDTFSAPRNGNFTADSTSSGYDEGSQSGTSGGISDGELEETAIVAEQIRDGGSSGDSTDGTRIVVVAVVDPADDDPEVATQNYLRDNIASKQGDYKDIRFDNIANAANALVVATLTEEVFFEGSLREALGALSGNEGRGLPLDGDLTTQFNEFAAVSEGDADADALDNKENDPDRDCFAGAGTSHYVAMEWWLPINHGNQVQTDSVVFDVGFYTEQCRHNDGAGMAPEDTVDILTAESEIRSQPGGADQDYPGSFGLAFDGSTATVDLSGLPESFPGQTAGNDNVGVFFGNGGTATSEVKLNADGSFSYGEHNGGDAQTAGDFSTNLSGDVLTVTAPAGTYDSIGVLATMVDGNAVSTGAVATATGAAPWNPGVLYQL
jgi:predicted ribosomally synthesized peptide with SipW-like signal peptide